jgi:flagellar hook-associated protein 3 FlgL
MVARVSQSMLLDAMQGDLRRTYNQFYEAQRQAATGRKVDKASDDPAAKQTLVQNHEQIRALETFDRNTQQARKMFRTAESALGEVGDLMHRARELAIHASNGATTASDRQAIKEEAEQILSQVQNVANQKLEGKYLFAGTATDTQAVTRTTGANGRYNFTYNGDAQATEYTVAEGERITYDYAAKDPGSSLQTALETLGTLVQGFDGGQFDHLLANNEADPAQNLADPNSGLPVDEFTDANGDGLADAGDFELTVTDANGNTATVGLTAAGGNQLDPESQSLNDVVSQLNNELNGQALGGNPDIGQSVTVQQDNGRLEIEAEDGLTFEITTDATNLAGVLGWDADVPQMQGALKDLDRAVEAVADERGQLGARMNRVDLVEDRRQELATDLEKLQTELGEVDVYEAYSQLAQRQQTLQAAMQSSLMLQRTTILNHL